VFLLAIAGQTPYQVANELVGVRGETIRRESHAKRQATLSLRASIGDAPAVEDDTGRGISERLWEGTLGKSRRQICDLSVSAASVRNSAAYRKLLPQGH